MKSHGNIDFTNTAGGTSFPTTASVGEMFFKNSAPAGLYYFTGTNWESVATVGEVDSAVTTKAGIKRLKDAEDVLDDNFTQYLNNDRADLRYAPISRDNTVIVPISFTTGTTLIPYDNTIPQKTEGTQIVSGQITLKDVNSKVLISGYLVAETGTAGRELTLALFCSSLNALGVVVHYGATAGQPYTIPFCFIDQPGFIDNTYTLRFGVNSAATWKVNKSDTTNGAFGGKLSVSNLVIQEI